MDKILYIYLLLSVSAWRDFCSKRIPNWWLLGWLSGWFLLFCTQHLGAGVAGFLLGALVIITLFFPLFCVRMIGAADVKLMALLCGCMGLKRGMVVIGLAFVVGALWSLIRFSCRVCLTQRLSYFFAYIRQLFKTGYKIPYYLPSRDGENPVIPFAVCLLLGMAVFTVWI